MKKKDKFLEGAKVTHDNTVFEEKQHHSPQSKPPSGNKSKL